MAKLNTKTKAARSDKTHEGAQVYPSSATVELSRALMSCVLWEDQFYESGISIADRIAALIPQVHPKTVALLAFTAREDMKLRHAPLLVAREMARHQYHKGLVKSLLPQIIQRADELSEFLAIYWKDGKQPLSAQVKKGLAASFTKFTEYDLAKYNRDSDIKLRDVLFLCHAKPKDKKQEKLWKRLIEDKLEVPDTWEVALSSGADKKKTWERLIKEENLGGLALLRNLRNMREVNVNLSLIKTALSTMKTDKILPYRFIAAARYAPDFEPELEKAMFSTLDKSQKFSGRTALLVDVSGSMDSQISGRSEMTRLDAACALAVLLRELGDTSVFTFSDKLVNIPGRRGFALRDAIVHSQPHNGTQLGGAINTIPKGYDRLIAITDEQSHDQVGAPPCKLGYMLNVASAQNGVGYGKWTSISGWSEHITRYIQLLEKGE